MGDNITLLPTVPSMMPTNFPDLIWIWATGVTVLLLGLVVYYLREMRAEQKATNNIMMDVLVKQKGEQVRLQDHIDNTGMHCKGVACPAMDRRLAAKD